MLKRIWRFSVATVASLFLFPTVAKAEQLTGTKMLYPNSFRVSFDGITAEWS